MSEQKRKTYHFVGEYPIRQLLLGSAVTKILRCQTKDIVIRLFEKKDINFYKSLSKFQKYRENLIHPHLLQYYEFRENVMTSYKIDGVSYTEQNNIFISEYLPNGTLNQYIRTSARKPLESNVIMTIFYQIMEGLKHLHKHDLYHLNLNCNNLIFDENMNIKIAGYLNTKQKQKLLSASDPNKVYSAPEVLKNLNYDPSAADIYSCGILLFAIAYHLDPNQFFKMKKQEGISKRLSKYPKIVKNQVINSLIDKMTSQNPQSRPTLEQIYNHPWFNKEKILLSEEQLKEKLLVRVEQKIKCMNKNNFFHTFRSENDENADPVFQNIINTRNISQQNFLYKEIPTSTHILYLNPEHLLKSFLFLEYSLLTQKIHIYPNEYEIQERYQVIYNKESQIMISCSINEIMVHINIQCSRSYGEHILLQFDVIQKSQHAQWIMNWLILKIEWISRNVQ